MKKTTPQEQTPQQEKQEKVKVDTEPTVSEDAVDELDPEAEWAAKIVEKAKAQLAALEKRQAPELEA
jgi:hypothetical protein